MTELADAIVHGRRGQVPDFPPPLFAAASMVPHLRLCGEASYLQCQQCIDLVKLLRSALAAAAPIIERACWLDRCDTVAEDLSKLPGSSAEVTASRMAWYFASRAQARLCTDGEFAAREARAFVGEFAAAAALRRLAAGDSSADPAAREIYQALMLGELAGEQLAQWLREWRDAEVLTGEPWAHLAATPPVVCISCQDQGCPQCPEAPLPGDGRR